MIWHEGEVRRPDADEGDGPDPRRWLALWVITAAIFISAVDTTIVNLALPDIAADLGASVNELQWVLDGFLVALASLLLVGGGLADRFGRKRIFLTGFAGFAVASLLAAASTSPVELIAARVLMGVSIACVLPPALSLMSVIFPANELPRAIGIWSAVAGIGIALGPVIGGILVEEAGWRWVFLVNVPVAVIAIPFGLSLLPESRRPGTPALDLPGVALSTVALGGIVFALIEGVARGWTSAPVLAAIVIGLGALAAFVRLELHRDEPLFDITVLRGNRVRAGAVALMALYGSLMGMLFLVPQYLQYVQGRSALVSGLALAPVGIGLAVTSPLGKRLTARHTPRKVMGWGMLVMATGYIPLALLDEGSPLIQVIAGATIIGFTYGFSITPATTVVLEDLGPTKAGDASAVNQLGRQVGGALGVAIVGSVFAAIYASSLDSKLGHLSQKSRDLAGSSLEGARSVAAKLPGETAQGVLDHAYSAFDSAARLGLVVCGLFLVGAAVLALLSARASPDPD